jgi:Bacterial Ig domain/Calx-beta domain/Nidogen-like
VVTLAYTPLWRGRWILSQNLRIIAAAILGIAIMGVARPVRAVDYVGTNTNLYGDDVALGPFPIGFSFDYFGASYTQFYPSTNGLLSFGHGYTTYSNRSFPDAGVANSIAPFWDDLITEGFTKKTILYRTVGTAPDRRLVVQWTNMFFYSNPSLPMGTFQAVLFEGSNRIQFQYRLLLGGAPSQGASATVGLDDSTGSSCSLQHSYNSAVLSEGAVLAFDPAACGYTSVTGTFEDTYLTDALAPAAPTLATPSHDATGVTTAPTLTWNAATNALSYRLLVASDAGFAHVVSDQSGLTATSASVSGLSTNTTYHWRVSATNDAGTAFSESWTFTTVAEVNHPPTTEADSYATNQGVTLSVAAPGVLGNDVDVDENPLAAALVSGPAHGSLTLAANGSFTYTPASGFNGVDSFTYAANDGSSDGNPASVTLSVNPLVSVADASSGESSGSIALAVTLSGPAVQTVTVAYATSNGGAIAGADYVATSGILTFPVGVSSRVVNVLLLADALNEDDEAFSIALSSPVNTALDRATAVATIADDDPLPSVSIDDVTVAEGNDGTSSVSFSLTLSAAAGRPVSVSWATADATALAGSDYVSSSGTVTFPAGTTSEGVSVQIIGDTTDEPDESFQVDLSSPVHATLARSAGTATLQNDDAPPRVSVDDVAVAEGNSATTGAVFTVSLSAASGKTVTVAYQTADGTAAAGADYQPASGVLTFAPGVSSLSLPVTVVGDLLNEADEGFILFLSSPVNATLERSVGAGTIRNDDPLPSLSVDDVTVSEGNSGGTEAVFTVSLSAPSGRPISVSYETADATAHAGSDYDVAAGALTFPEGETSRSLSVHVHGDTFVESDESFLVNLASPVNATLGDGQGVGIIRDGDCDYTLSPRTAAIDAGGANGSFHIVTGTACSWTVAAPAGVSLGSAASGQGPEVVSYTVSPNPRKSARTLTVTVEGRTYVLTQDGAPRRRPVAPVLAAPSGTILSTSPSYTWYAVSGASSYAVRVNGPEGKPPAKTYRASDLCSGSRCTLAPEVSLVHGSHDWVVRAANAMGASPWSAGLRFSVTEESEGVPGLVDPVAPLGDVVTHAPDYSWKAAAGALTYELIVEGPAGHALSVAVKATEACPGATCRFAQPSSLPDGAYTIKLRGRNASGFGPWSVAAGFSVRSGDAAVLQRPALVAPVGGVSVTPPTFAWRAIRGADSYVLHVSGPAGDTDLAYESGRVCVGRICSATVPVLSTLGAYRWSVEGTSDAGASASSATASFRLGSRVAVLPGTPLASALSPAVGDVTPSYSWSAAAGATAYFLRVDGPDANRISTWYPASVCSGGVCTARPRAPLGAGSYSLQVLARTRTAFGAWSAPAAFVVDPGVQPPDAPAVLGPAGLVQAATPTYTWSRVPGAASYRLWIEGPSGVVLDASYNADDVCVADTCSVVPDTALESGPHALWVQAASVADVSPWSDVALFAIENGASLPGPVSPTAPSGVVSDSSPTYSWAALATANGYRLVVEGEAGVVLDETYTVAEACEAGACAVTPQATLADGDYSWSVQALNQAGAGPDSFAFTFTVEQ